MGGCKGLGVLMRLLSRKLAPVSSLSASPPHRSSDCDVGRSKRRGSVRPPKAKRNEVRRILEVAAAHAAELHELWLNTHGGKTDG